MKNARAGKRKARFRVGQVVALRNGSHDFRRIEEVSQFHPYQYWTFTEGYASKWVEESDLRPLTARECGPQAGKGSKPPGRSSSVSVLQKWVEDLPLRVQGTLLTAVRGCDDEAKVWSRTGVAYSPGRRLTAFIRWCFMNPADAREVDIEEGAFFMSTPPEPFKPSQFGHLPQHWYAHAMHALECIAYCHPDVGIAVKAHDLYMAMVHNLHLNEESSEQMHVRLTEDRIKNQNVVS